jgi:hypothetical protein
MRDMALRAIACLRADAFSNRVKDISIVSWDGSSVKSEVVERARKLLLDPQQLSARDWTGQLSEAVARAEHEIQQWKAEQARLETIHLERKAELERQLTSVGFIVQPHHVRVKCGRGFTTELELDVRHELAVEFSGIDPPLPVGVSVDGCLCVIDDNDVVKIADARSRPIPGPVDIELFRRCACRKPPLWRQSLASASWSSTVICLRWPPRLDYEGSRLLSNIVTDLESPVRVPVDLEMIAARRGTLLRALRAHGLAESRIPLGVGANGCAVAAVFLSKKSWPRSREMHSALVGDVASAQRGDIFASLPQLAIGVIYDCLVESWSSRSRTSLATVSDAFALGAAILEIERLPLKTAFKFPSPKLKPKVVPAFQATDRFDQFDDDPYHDNDYYDDDYYRSDYDYHYRY